MGAVCPVCTANRMRLISQRLQAIMLIHSALCGRDVKTRTTAWELRTALYMMTFAMPHKLTPVQP